MNTRLTRSTRERLPDLEPIIRRARTGCAGSRVSDFFVQAVKPGIGLRLAWVRELVTMIHLAKYTGAPASCADEIVRQIASAVEGLTNIDQRTKTKAPSIVTR